MMYSVGMSHDHTHSHYTPYDGMSYDHTHTPTIPLMMYSVVSHGMSDDHIVPGFSLEIYFQMVHSAN